MSMQMNPDVIREREERLEAQAREREERLEAKLEAMMTEVQGCSPIQLLRANLPMISAYEIQMKPRENTKKSNYGLV